MNALTPIAVTLEQLATGRVSCSTLVNGCLDAIADPRGEGKRAFLRVAADAARQTAAEFDAGGYKRGPLAGLPISIKDLLDVAGERTLAGSVVLANSEPKARDAVVVERLKRSGAVIVGRTNMTEFAFSALGLNPHYGTPRNPYDRATGRIPGGSSSGAAVSVTDGMAYAAIGSDTGGSVRIPAALCGLVGFKPTARRVPTEGAYPLSSTLDSLGPLAPTVECCALMDAVLADEELPRGGEHELAGLRLGVLQGYVIERLEKPVADAFDAALSLLSSLGAKVTEVRFASLDRIPAANQGGGFVAAEAYAWHRSLMEDHSAEYDPRVLTRILRGARQSAADYIDLLQTRRQCILEASSSFEGYDAVLLPTLACTAPALAELEASDQAYVEANALILRNPSIINFLDGCALSIPCQLPGEAPVGLMVAGLAGQDRKILSAGAAIEAALASAGRAVHVARISVRSSLR